ncbi:uncharacterized protein F5891DRAFT_1182561 [Suillus fuscotomentosus]|uniref:Uncharacterized protein n=1 Tax=Suillus fuscotomentosus TaxID=1912939 RepID=A0AAD4HRP5_9AGAM|nr:uncharacterized protein F5891DRAFT_1182561 [Suillus fuscotomentosus]KAG1906312.1 hypothetical protein F5891DRAFT_1182561 [Suillus fuscotomentosus]
MLPPAIQDFLDLSLDPDFDGDPDLDGYQADTSCINTNDSIHSTRSSTPFMTLSDDLLSNPACWPTSHALRIRARLLSLMELPHVPTTKPPQNDPSSITEPESDVEEPLIKLIPPKDDLSSVTEPESGVEEPLIKLLPPKDDPSSVTEPESDVEEPSISATITPKKKSFFDTLSPPGLDSLYWKYVSREEDAKWNDHAHTDESFDAVHQIKKELADLS